VTTLTKKMAEELTDFLDEHGVRVRYLHSDVDTLRRVELLTELRQGVYDVLVGINLLREGLDLPEVSLVAILDADKEGFLRSTTSLIQTIGRAARNVSGEVHMYADRVTDSMKRALEETERRRDIQLAYNREHGIDPQPLRKKIADITDQLAREEADTAELLSKRKKDPRVKDGGRGKAATPLKKHDGIGAEGAEQLEQTIADLTQQMVQAAEQLKFELAARLRDEVSDLKSALRQMEQAGHA
jgi:excinuclease ABC subunit B